VKRKVKRREEKGRNGERRREKEGGRESCPVLSFS